MAQERIKRILEKLAWLEGEMSRQVWQLWNERYPTLNLNVVPPQRVEEERGYIIDEIVRATQRRVPLVVLHGPERSGKTSLLKAVQKRLGEQPLLVDVAREKCKGSLGKLVDEILKATSRGPVLVDEADSIARSLVNFLLSNPESLPHAIVMAIHTSTGFEIAPSLEELSQREGTRVRTIGVSWPLLPDRFEE